MARTPEEDGAKPVPIPPRPPHLKAVEVPPPTPKPKRPRYKVKLSAVTEDFFREAKPHSIVKSAITWKFFKAWAYIMRPRARTGKIAYIDLYAGKGVYDDGTDSTPMLIMKTVAADESLRRMVVSFFADADPECIESLRKNIASIPDIDKLAHKPQFAVGAAHEHGLAEFFEKQSVVPTFLYLDPFGYHGLSAKLIRAILKDWGCDVIFFFSYARIRAALLNRLVRDQMDALFGHERVEALNAALPKIKTQSEKETLILAALEEALREVGGNFVQTFRFLNEDGHVTHHLVFATKNETARDIMKEIMGAASSSFVEEVPSFEHRENEPIRLFDAETPIHDLKCDLLGRYRGKTMTIEDIYKDHNYKTRFVRKNYQEAFRQLFYDENKVSAVRVGLKPALNAEKRTMPFESTQITFDEA